MSLMIAVVVLLSRTRPWRPVDTKAPYPQPASFFTFVMLFAYFDFSRAADHLVRKPAGRDYLYRTRLYGEWGVVAVIVLVFHFFVPFFCCFRAT
jgi:hypothetical protein